MLPVEFMDMVPKLYVELGSLAFALRPAVAQDLTTSVQLLLHGGMILVAVGTAFLLMLLQRFYDGRPEPAGRTVPILAGLADDDRGVSRRPRWQGTGRRGAGAELFGESGLLIVCARLLIAAAILIATSALRVSRGEE